ncbi:MAG TPA: protein kinase [Pirellulales bacterium]|jgi:serine/threonine protein kinase|nr:protein kinase [Pirellulales bacterium]
MRLSVQDFWKLAIAGRLFSIERCKQLHAAFVAEKGQSQPDARQLAEWLMKSKALTAYQAKVLLSGQPGPFWFGDYLLEDRIERGRFKGAFQARPNDASQPGVLLLFADDWSPAVEDPYERLDELTKIAAVSSPHVHRILGWVSAEPDFAVAQLIDGHTLADVLAAGRPGLREACRLAFHAALGLVQIHGKGLVHGAIGTDNLWVEGSGTLKILQFPFVPSAAAPRVIDERLADYVAPELFNPRAPATPLSDIYSLGCVLYELVCGHPPFPGGDVRQKTDRHRRELPARLDKLDEKVPEEIGELAAEMLDKEAMLRCESATNVAHRLAGWVAGKSNRAALPPTRADGVLPPGYGAWHAPAWQAPPQDPSAIPRVVASPAKQASTPPAPRLVSPAAEVPEPAGARAEPAGDIEIDFPLPVRSGPPAPELVPATSLAAAAVTPEPLPFSPAKKNRHAHHRVTQTTMIVVLCGVAALVLLGILVLAMFASSEPTESSSAAAPEISTVENVEPDMPPAERAVSERNTESRNATPELADDDGATLWDSPTAGSPTSLRFLPAGAAFYLVVRPRALLETTEGQRVLEAVEASLGLSAEHWRAPAGLQLAELDEAAIAILPDASKTDQWAFAFRPTNMPEAVKLLEHWGDPARKVHAGEVYYANQGHAYWLPPSSSSVVVGPESAVRSLIEAQGAPPLAPGIERLLPFSDAERELNVFFVPRQLITLDEGSLPAGLDQLRLLVPGLFDEGVDGVLLSAHLGPELFIEMRALASSKNAAGELAAHMLANVRSWNVACDKLLATWPTEAYGRKLVERMPQMLKLLGHFSRAEGEERTAVLRSYLPAAAGHNLLLATFLALGQETTASEPTDPGVQP